MSNTRLEELYQLWKIAHDRRDWPTKAGWIKAARLLTASRHPEFWPWLANALLDNQRKFFVAAFFHKYPVPKRMFKEMIRAAVYAEYASFCDDLIKPCITTYGTERVCNELLPYLESGTDVEKAGAAVALHWATYRGAPEKILKQVRRLFLIEFVNNPDLRVRRSIAPHLEWTRFAYPIRLWRLVPRAYAIARSHPDEFIRQWADVRR